MLFNFQIELASKLLAFKSKRNNSRKADQYYNTYYVKDKRFHRSKTYKHFGYTNNSQSYATIEWIENNIILGPGISDYRKVTIDLILAPYLVNVKKYDYNTTYNTIIEWLDKCAKKRPLDFNAPYKVRYILSHVKDKAVLWPMRQDTMKEKYPEMHEEIFSNSNSYLVDYTSYLAR
jgi:Primase X